jgi:hypothetical protein
MPECHQCGAEVEVHEPLARDAECPACRRDLRCCLNCRHYDTRYHNSCRETQAEPVEDKDRRNFCEFFAFSREPRRPAAATGTKQPDARARLDALFKGGKPTPEPPSNARGKLDALFKKPAPGGGSGEKKDE